MAAYTSPPRRKVESLLKLDVRRWPRSWRLAPPLPRTELTVSLSYGGSHHTITIIWEPCGGGWRRWLRCPQCSTRRAALYLHGGTLRCRVCRGLRYHTQTVSREERIRLKFVKWRERQGLSGSLDAPFPPRRPGQHYARYQRMALRDAVLRRAALAAWTEAAQRTLGIR